ELGARLVRACKRERTTATLNVDCENERMTSQSVTATLGPDMEREVLVTAHHDAHDISEGATDNAAGCAAVAEVARLLATMEESLETRVRFVTFGAEELHLLGSEAWTADTDPETIKTVINLDGIGSSRDPVVSTHGIDAIDATFREVSDELGVPIERDGGLVPWGDQWPFVYRGVPGAMVSSKAESDALRGWGHTHADTLDKVDRRDLRALAVSVAAAVCKLAEADREVDRRSPDAVRQRAIDEGHAEGMRLTGVWPWD
ncbi:M28 family metallopeptidase, partial [Natronococcus sp.]|uniref:M28 family metallopeptidase n=1 Tax=Natronococcus sp. TaxID=35747 RepID=UPI003A4DF9B4